MDTHDLTAQEFLARNLVGAVSVVVQDGQPDGQVFASVADGMIVVAVSPVGCVGTVERQNLGWLRGATTREEANGAIGRVGTNRHGAGRQGVDVRGADRRGVERRGVAECVWLCVDVVMGCAARRHCHHGKDHGETCNQRHPECGREHGRCDCYASTSRRSSGFHHVLDSTHFSFVSI